MFVFIQNEKCKMQYEHLFSSEKVHLELQLPLSVRLQTRAVERLNFWVNRFTNGSPANPL